MRSLGWFLLVVGVAIASLWAILLTTGQVPEVADGRLDIWFHIAAEVWAALLLLVAGLALLRAMRGASLLAGIAIGALSYTVVNSAGYYAEAGEWPVVVLFGSLLLPTLWAGYRLVRGDREMADNRALLTRPATRVRLGRKPEKDRGAHENHDASTGAERDVHAERTDTHRP